MWFIIKQNGKCKDDAVNLWRSIKYLRYLPIEETKIVDVVIDRNSYFAHPENVLIAMLFDKDKNVRKLTAERILAVRKSQKQKKNGIKRFIKPKINFETVNYFDLIDWTKCIITEPPLTSKFTDVDLESHVEENEFSKVYIVIKILI